MSSSKIGLDDIADLSTLPNRMRWAAKVLEEASERFRQCFPDQVGYWYPQDLRKVANDFEDEDGHRLTVNDSRIAQARALVDDARCLLADIEEELGAVTPIELRGARGDLNVALRRLNRLEKV